MNHEFYMQQALDLAKQGWPQVAPNPMVGCVIVHKNEVVSSGFHKKFGDAHAEVVAINAMSPKIPAGECVLYVSLEPCSHHGKTPPCTDLILSKGFKTVVVACKDPNPAVSGNGLKQLAEGGIEVITDILRGKARELNKHFITFHEQKRPYFILKWALTADGFISRVPLPKDKDENIITRREAQVYVHQLRAGVMAIFVGKNTVLNDNPRLTTRLVQGKNPIRIFIDKKLEVPQTYNIYNNEAKTIVFNGVKEGEEEHIRFIKLYFEENILSQICRELYKMQIQSVLVEGGAFLVNEFVKQELWDEVLVFQNPGLYFKEGLKGPVFALKNTFELVGDDKLFHHFKNETLPAKGPLSKEIF
jgi:diaminohydroxyphosphoribosylaminopyrimidine deaminase/5-amino-6-(5-phosphoribosylamino)uracil reductase